MKTGLLTWISLLGNAVLVWALWLGGHSREKPAPPPVSSEQKPVQSAIPQTPDSPAISPVTEPVSPKWPPFRWDEVASPNYTNYVANLRRIGCPEETVAHIVRGGTLTDLMRVLYAGSIPRHDVVYQVFSGGEDGFKKIEVAFEPVKEERKKRDALIAALLDRTPDDTDTAAPAAGDRMNGAAQSAKDRTAREFSYVDPERRELLAAMAAENAMKASQLGSSLTRAESREQRRLLAAELQAAQLEVLSGPEREEYERRRWKDGHGREFAAMSLIADSPEELQSFAGMTPEQLSQALGPERAADLERISDRQPVKAEAGSDSEAGDLGPLIVRGDFRDLRAVARRFGLSDEHPRAALDVIREYETTLKTVHADGILSPRERRQLVRALGAERDARVEAILGSEAWQTYRFHFGNW